MALLIHHNARKPVAVGRINATGIHPGGVGGLSDPIDFRTDHTAFSIDLGDFHLFFTVPEFREIARQLEAQYDTEMRAA